MFTYQKDRGSTLALGALLIALAACQGHDVSGPHTPGVLVIPHQAELLANAPTRSVADVSRGPLAVFYCDGFDAIGTFYGTISTIVFYDGSGHPVRLINQYNTNSVIVNSVTGKKIVGTSSGPDIVTLEPGADVVVSSGLITNFTDESGRHLIFATGRVVQRFDADGTVETVFTAGPIDDYLGTRRAQVCAALAG